MTNWTSKGKNLVKTFLLALASTISREVADLNHCLTFHLMPGNYVAFYDYV